MRFATASLLFASQCLLASSLTAAESGAVATDRLDIEKIVIEGRLRPPNSDLTRMRPQLLPPSAIESEPLHPEPGQKRTTWTDSIEMAAGNHQAWRLANSFHLLRNANTMGLLLAHEATDGFREGYEKNTSDIHLEAQRVHLNGAKQSLTYLFQTRQLDLPEPEHLFYRGRSRQEDASHLRFNFETPGPGPGQLESTLEFRNSFQVDSVSPKFRADLFRTSWIYRWNTWSTLLSLEKDRRDASDALIARFFVEQTRQILSERTTIQWGLGAYLFSYENDFLSRQGFVLFNRQNENDRSYSLSPLLHIDHVFDKRVAVFAHYSLLMESTNFIESYFDRPEFSRPSDLIRPSRQSEFEMGLRHKLEGLYEYSLAVVSTRQHDVPVTVTDANADNGKLTGDIFDRGRDRALRLSGEWIGWKYFALESQLEFHDRLWSMPRINYTPFESNRTFKGALRARYGKSLARLIYHHNGERKTWPAFSTLPSIDRFQFQLSTVWSERHSAFFHVDNLFDRHQVFIPGYPLPGRQFLTGLKLRL